MNITRTLFTLAVGLAIGATASPAQPLKIVATNSDLASMARRIAGPEGAVFLIVPPNMNPHTMPLRPSMIQKMREADLLLTIGLDHEPWLPDAITASGNGGIQFGSPGYVDCSQGISLINVPANPGDRAAGDMHVFGNTHYWMDPNRARFITVHILHALSNKLPGKQEEFRSRARALLSEIDAKIAEIERRMAKYRGTPVVIYHQGMDYLLMEFLKLELVGYCEVRPGIEPTPPHIARLQEKMKARGARAIFMEPYFNVGQAKSIAAPAGAKVGIIPASTGPDQEYTDWLESVVSKVEEGLKES